jgi:hypothetical protein
MEGKITQKYLVGYPVWHAAGNYICGLTVCTLRIIFGLFLSCLLVACFEEGDCLITNTTLVKVNLKSAKTRKDTTLTFARITTGPYLLYENRQLALLDLPVDPTATQTLFVLQRGDRKDSLTFEYRNESVVLSPTCGAFDYQRDVKVVKNTLGLDSVRWLNNRLIKNVKVNVEIFF